jgi:predicted nucleic acid-binding protein
MPPILIDTNLLISLHDFQTPEKQIQAQQVLDYLELGKFGRLSVQNLAEFFNVSTHKLRPSLTPSQALQQINLFVSMWPVFDLNPLIVMEAGRGVRDHQLSYYDAQIWATARLNQVPVVFREDLQGRQILEGVQFINPFSPEFILAEWL